VDLDLGSVPPPLLVTADRFPSCSQKTFVMGKYGQKHHADVSVSILLGSVSEDWLVAESLSDRTGPFLWSRTWHFAGLPFSIPTGEGGKILEFVIPTSFQAGLTPVENASYVNASVTARVTGVALTPGLRLTKSFLPSAYLSWILHAGFSLFHARFQRVVVERPPRTHFHLLFVRAPLTCWFSPD